MDEQQVFLTLVGRLVHIRRTAQKMIEEMEKVRQLFTAAGKGPEITPLVDFLNAEMDAGRLITTNVDCILGKDAETTPGEKGKTDPDHGFEIDSIMGAPNVNGVQKYPHIRLGNLDWFDA